MVHTAGPGPRLRAVLNLHPQQLKAIDVGLYPVLAGRQVFFKLAQQVTDYLGQHLLVQHLGQVLTELFLGLLIYLVVYLFGFFPFLGRNFNLDFEHRLVIHDVFVGQPQRGAVQCLINSHQ